MKQRRALWDTRQQRAHNRIVSHLQDVVVVGLREASLFRFTGTLTFKACVTPAQTNKAATQMNIMKGLRTNSSTRLEWTGGHSQQISFCERRLEVFKWEKGDESSPHVHQHQRHVGQTGDPHFKVLISIFHWITKDKLPCCTDVML